MKAFSDGIVDKQAAKEDDMSIIQEFLGQLCIQEHIAAIKPLGKRPCDVNVDVNFVLSMFGKEKLKWYVENHAKEKCQ